MYEINLIPWRERLQKRKLKAFITLLTLCFGIGAIIVSTAWLIASDNRRIEQARADYLDSRIAFVNSQLREIKEIEDKKKTITERIKVISSLQGDRHLIVRLFDSLAENTPDGVYFTSATKTKNLLTLTGLSTKNNEIADLLRNLDRSDVFSNPNLTYVNKVDKNSTVGRSGMHSEFLLTVIQNIETGDDAGEGAKHAKAE
ncbi:PilN domain-containing protein [Endozoicomonas gorgoniicola]|uniref:PilN domain-containing protein n=1 Tax=Endozoicomonas gorgoniicola TaxID=1234144 RepID=A0ABT3MXX3_9GAMM|nr:PilN domain-containing protein [Endozoicomonas gorgoniicola]MCW7554221.1 PilN domain-containing protein [Endozoicomonas gorgoniicola]